MARYGERMARARVWFYRYEDGSTDLPGVIAEVNEARRALKRAIADRLDAPEAEQRRMAGILNQAAAAIRQGDDSPHEPEQG
jgi:hypothetical protein